MCWVGPTEMNLGWYLGLHRPRRPQIERARYPLQCRPLLPLTLRGCETSRRLPLLPAARRNRRSARRPAVISAFRFLELAESMAWGGLFLSLSRPTPEQQKSCLAAAGGFNYDADLHGATHPKSPTTLTTSEDTDKVLADRGFSVNRSRVLVGSGADTFRHAKSALLSWKHLALGWAEAEPGTPVKAGARFCICYKEVVPWVMFPLQIAYVVADDDYNGGKRGRGGDGGVFAFGSGTLQGHLLAGEERFSVEVDAEERVWYEVVSFSKPAHPLSALCYPYVRLRQRHFARESGKAVLRHVAAAAACSSTTPTQ